MPDQRSTSDQHWFSKRTCTRGICVCSVMNTKTRPFLHLNQDMGVYPLTFMSILLHSLKLSTKHNASCSHPEHQHLRRTHCSFNVMIFTGIFLCPLINKYSHLSDLSHIPVDVNKFGRNLFANVSRITSFRPLNTTRDSPEAVAGVSF